MKWIALALIVVFSTHALGKRCDNNDECEADQCCAKFFGWGKLRELPGLCQALEEKDSKCSYPLLSNGEKPDYYSDNCPCQEGLECVPTSTFVYKGIVSKINPKCKPKKE